MQGTLLLSLGYQTGSHLEEGVSIQPRIVGLLGGWKEQGRGDRFTLMALGMESGCALGEKRMRCIQIQQEKLIERATRNDAVSLARSR